MAPRNVRLVQDVYALGLDPRVVDRAFDEYLSEDFEFRTPARYPDAEVYRGREGLLRWEKMLREVWGESRFEPQEFRDLGDRVLVLTRVVAEGGSSGVRLDAQTGHLWSFREGRATSVEIYLDPAEALEAVGLGEEA
jgi:ketosteroid isomerase-like protein